METVEIRVVQTPVKVAYDCPICEIGVELDYSDFCSNEGEPCDWSRKEIVCDGCGERIEIDSVEWD